MIRAMILAAGRGERMRPLTDHTPKPLLMVGGKRLIEWQIERLAQAGLHQLVINHAWLGEQIPATLGDGTRYGLTIHYSAEASALETAGGIVQALPLLGDEYFLVSNGDIYCEFDYSRLIARVPQMHRAGLLAWLVLVPNPVQHPEGDFSLSDDRVEHENHASRYTFSGIGLYHPDLFSGIQPGARAKLGPLLHAACARHQVGGELFTGCWHDIGTPERLLALDQVLQQTLSSSSTKV